MQVEAIYEDGKLHFSFAAELKVILSPISAELASASNQSQSKSEIREARVDAWKEKRGG